MLKYHAIGSAASDGHSHHRQLTLADCTNISRLKRYSYSTGDFLLLLQRQTAVPVHNFGIIGAWCLGSVGARRLRYTRRGTSMVCLEKSQILCNKGAKNKICLGHNLIHISLK